MQRPLVCMSLTGSSLEEDVKLTKEYEKYIDLVELRVDYLSSEEQLNVRKFPTMVSKPCILTIRREIDGGRFTGSDFSRTILFARALSFANTDKSKNFAYVDFEEDFNIPSIQDAAQAFGVKIIRSFHNMTGPVTKIKEKFEQMHKTGYEIPKIAFMPNSLADVENLFREASKIKGFDFILCAMGVEGFSSRVLASFSGSYLTFVSPREVNNNTKFLGHTDPVSLQEVYNFNSITKSTQLFGITAWPTIDYKVVELQNSFFKNKDLNAVYFPLISSVVSETLAFADYLGIKGLSIDSPYKEAIMYYLQEQSPDVTEIRSCNTIVKKNNKWIGYNTDIYGFKKALEEFLDGKRIKWKKVAIIGAGGAAKAAAYVLKQMGARVCVFNRTLEHARLIAEKYGFKYCQLDASCTPILKDYTEVIIQTTSIGMNSDGTISKKNDPLYFYEFTGKEMLFDFVYNPDITPIMKRATLAGCKVCNGYKMLEYQSQMQFELFQGHSLENIKNHILINKNRGKK